MQSRRGLKITLDSTVVAQVHDTSSPHWNPHEFIQELRGDVRREAIDIYDHIDKKALRESYLAHIPQLGI